jgi:hypothetical protein
MEGLSVTKFWQRIKYWLIDHIPMRCCKCGRLRWRKDGYWVMYARVGQKVVSWQCKECF